MTELPEQTERFKELLDIIYEEVNSLKQEIRDQKKENSKLVSKIEELRGKQTDIFSAISESERLALRQHVQGLVSKIDNHLNNQV